AIVRAGLEAMLAEGARFEPIRSDLVPADLSHLPLLRSDSQPDVVLADIGHVTTPTSLENPSSLPLVLLIDDVSRSELIRSLRVGVNAILSRDARRVEIFAALEAAAAGLTVLGATERDLLLPGTGSEEGEYEPTLERLSERELEVLALMAQGLANKNI